MVESFQPGGEKIAALIHVSFDWCLLMTPVICRIANRPGIGVWELLMKKLSVLILVVASLFMGGCQSFQKDRDLEMYLVGAGLSYAIGKHVCRHSEFVETCGVSAAAAFVIWY